MILGMPPPIAMPLTTTGVTATGVTWLLSSPVATLTTTGLTWLTSSVTTFSSITACLPLR